MAKVHDLFIVELAEVIKGYGNNPDDKDPFRLSEFYRFYELPNIAVSRENFEKMRPFEERKKGKWINIRHDNIAECDQCGITGRAWMNFCFDCGADMRNPVETARDIVHEAIDNSVWSDTVDTAKMHKVVDNKYAEIRGDANADANT